MEEFLNMLGITLIMGVNVGVPVLLIVGVNKLWDWRREYRQLVKRVADLEARVSAPPQ